MSEKKTILIVDDDEDTLRGLEVRLKANGYETCVAPDGFEAWGIIQAKPPDLILLDIGLPLGSGYDIMKFLRDRIDFAKMPVIVVSGQDPKTNRDRALEGGAVAYFQKPANPADLMSAICEALGQIGNTPVASSSADTFEKQMQALREEYYAKLPGKMAVINDLWKELPTSGEDAQALQTVLQLCHNMGGASGELGFPIISKKAQALDSFLRPITTSTRQPSAEERSQIEKLLADLEQAIASPALDTTTPLPSTTEQPKVILGHFRRKILLVDDDGSFRQLYKLILERAGYKVLTAEDGEKAWELLESEKPDLILLDILLPKVSGLEILEKIRAKESTRNIPVILFSKLGEPEDIREGFKMGANDYVVKGAYLPRDKEVLAKIRALIGY